MRSPIDHDNTDEHWEVDRWQGYTASSIHWALNANDLSRRFDLEWLSWNSISYDDIRHLRHREDGGPPIAQTYDGVEICRSSGLEMMQRFGL